MINHNESHQLDRRRRKIAKIGIYTHIVLLELGHLLDEVHYSSIPYRKLRWAARREHFQELRRLRQILWRLEQQGLIERHGRGLGGEIVVTDSGQRRIQRLLADTQKSPRLLPWDGKWHIISFDVPETHRIGRTLLRRKLRQLNCFPIQRSVFIYPYDLRQLVEEIRQAYDLRTDIIYFVAEEIEGRREMTDMFINRGILPKVSV